MKVWLFIIVTYLAGGVQTNQIPMDNMAACMAAKEQVMRQMAQPNTTITASCVVQGQ